jgi:acetylornithine deacetylase/succinyl-diaminopimelate desuccinylase-like protein
VKSTALPDSVFLPRFEDGLMKDAYLFCLSLVAPRLNGVLMASFMRALTTLAIPAPRSWCALLGLTAVLGLPTSSTDAATPVDYRPLAREMLQELIEIKSSDSGVGSTPAAEAIARHMRAAGFPESDTQVIGPSERKKNVVVRLHGRSKAKPLLIIGHLDVVEAEKGDWSPDIDPFKLTERDGYFYGRGTQDMKGADTIAAVNFIRWKQQGWIPSRDLILALTADEELYGDEDGVDWLLKHRKELIDAEYSINPDAGDFLTRNGKPYSVALAAGEKKEVILQLVTRNRGGHGSRPREDNAIYELNAAVDGVAKLKFPVMLNDVTRAQFTAMSMLEAGQVTADMKAVARNPPDATAVDRLSKDPFYNALLRTTCVATMLKAGHGPSALPQRAEATLNCRILPGQTSAWLMNTLREAIADDGVAISWQFNEPSDPPASALRPDLFSAVRKAVDSMWPGVTVLPGMMTGMTDSRFLRAADIPSYGVTGLFIEEGDNRFHGKDERIRVSDFYAGLEFYDRFIKALVGP